MLMVKNTVQKIGDAFNAFISRLDVVEKRISDLKDITMGPSKTKNQEKKTKIKQSIQELWDNYKSITYM